MLEAPIPLNDRARVASLRSLAILDTPREERFDRLTRLASMALDAPIALVSLIDEERQWFKSCVGLEATETPRSVSICGHAIMSDAPTIIPDTLQDPRFADNPLVTAVGLRFYAGVPLIDAKGFALGMLCVADYTPRELDPRRFGGTGLGLALSRRLAQLLGGDLELFSEQQVGTTALLRLPVPKAVAPAGDAEPLPLVG